MNSLPLVRRSPILSRERIAWALRWAVFWGAMTQVALIAAGFLTSSVVFAAAPAAVAVIALVCDRYPLLAFGLVATMAGTFVTVQVLIGLPVYFAMSVLLLGLWLAAVPRMMMGRTEATAHLWPGAVMLMALGAIAVIYMALSDDLITSVYAFRVTYWWMLGGLLVAYAPWPVVSRWLVEIVLAAGLIAAAYGVFRYVVGPAGAERAYAERVGRGFTSFAGDIRPLGGAGDAHGLASAMVPLVPFSLAMLLGVRDRFRVILAGVVLVMSAFMLVVSDVRSGLACAAVGCAVVLLLLFAAQGLGVRRLLAGGLGILLAIVTVFAVVATQGSGKGEFAQRFRAILTPESDQSFQERLFVWRNALDEIDTKPFGHGFGVAGSDGRIRSRFITAGTKDVVSSYLRVAFEQGLWVAALLAVTLIAIALALCRAALTATDPRSAAIALGAAGTTIAFGLLLNFESNYIEVGTAALSWMVIGLGMRQVSLRPRTH